MNENIKKPPTLRPIRRSQEMEGGWNSRFQLGKLPNYTPLYDNHCQTYVGSLNRKRRNIKIRRIKSPNFGMQRQTYEKRPMSKAQSTPGIRKMSQFTVNNQVVSDLREELQFTYEEKKLDTKLASVFIEHISSIPYKEQALVLAREIDAALKNRSWAQGVLIAWKNRKQAIEQMRKQTLDDPHEILLDYVNIYRRNTMKVIEAVNVWRDELYKLFMPNKSCQYFHDNQDIFSVMKSDMNWLMTHSLSQRYEFGNSDPFILKPSMAFMTHSSSEQLDIPVSIDMETQMKKLEAILDEESPLNPKKNYGSAALLYQRAKYEYNRKASLGTSHSTSRTLQTRNIMTPVNTSRRTIHSSRMIIKEKLQDQLAAKQDTEQNVSQNKTEQNFNSHRQISPRFNTTKMLDNSLKLAMTQKSEALTKHEKSPLQSARPMDDLKEEASFDSDASSVYDEPKYMPELNQDEVSLIPFELGEEDAVSMVKGYLKHIQGIIRNTMSDLDTIKELGLDGCWFWVRSAGRDVGLLIFTIAPISSIKRINIVHLSCIHINQLQAVLMASIEYIFVQYPADEIRIQLKATQNEEDKLEIQSDIKNMVYNQGFKWVNLTNLKNKNRIMTLNLKRPESYEFENEPYLGYFEENIVCKIGTFMQLVNFMVKQEEGNEDVRGLFTLAACYQKLDPELKNTHSTTLNSLLTRVPEDFEYPNTKVQMSEKFEEAFDIIEQEDIELIGIRGQAKQYLAATTVIGLKWSSFSYMTHMIEGIYYSYIKIRGDIIVGEYKGHTVYAIQTENPQYACFFTVPLTQDRDMISNIKQKEIIHELWVPCFFNVTMNTMKSLTGQVVKDYCLKRCDEGVALQMKKVPPPEGSLRRTADRIIEEAFSFGVVFDGMDEDAFFQCDITSFSRMH